MKSGLPPRRRGRTPLAALSLAAWCLPATCRPRPTALALAAAFAFAATPMAHAQQEARVSFNIPSQSLYSALRAFSAQAHQQVLFDEATVANRRAPALQGLMAPRQALDQLLSGSGIQVIASQAGAYTLKGPQAGAQDATQLPTVRVTADGQTGTGPVIGYVAERSSAGTKSDTPLIKTPQAISVVTRDQMTAQNVQSVAQALRYTSGVTPEQRGTNTDSLEYLYARGFQVEQYWNGLRLPGSAAGYNVTSFNPYMLERIEVLHGPSSVLYGQGSPGGMVNLVSKMPTEEPLHEIGIQTGSYGRAEAFGDFSGALNKEGTLFYRLTADGFETGTQTNYNRQERYTVAPSIMWRPDGDTKLTVYAYYQSDPKAGGYNFVPAVGTAIDGVVKLPRRLDVGEPDFDSFRKTQESIGYAFEHRFNDTWSVKQNYRFLHNEQSIRYLSYSSVSSDGRTLLRTPYWNNGQVNAHALDNQLIARFGTGPLTHQVTLGADYQHTQYDHDFKGNLAGGPSLDPNNPVYGQTVPDPNFQFATAGDQTLRQFGLYAQDQIDIDNWSFLGGVREDWAHEQFDPYKAGTASTEQSDRAFTWRLGGVYKFDNGIAPYASYSKSFAPQIGTDYSGTPFQPTKGKQYEVGVKYQPPGYNSFVTLAGFHLTQENVTTTDPEHTTFSIQTGEVRSRGIELEGHASLSNNLQLIATYTYTDLLNTRSNSSNLNRVPVGIPRNAASLWADYTIASSPLAGLQVGAGVRYIGNTWGDTTNDLKLPSVTLVDLALHYDLGRLFDSMHGWTASLTASNLFDRDYLSYCSGGLCTWGAGRVVLAGLKYKW
ncbi:MULTISPECIES: TonB-dependent siderophore receptor [unclassified Achromobacter]|uniref:TonB-dependent siderophore receptor n=1 Tax=unclassified Achromobacter TaxID=2626865 RepID=UPI00117751CB|nr:MULTISPECIES: TonB-dependent siderophore receptor [unclassified Achromobacter]